MIGIIHEPKKSSKHMTDFVLVDQIVTQEKHSSVIPN